MTVQENMLQQIYQMAASMSGMPQTSDSGTAKEDEGASFQDLLDQSSKEVSQSKEQPKAEQREPVQDKEQPAGKEDSAPVREEETSAEAQQLHGDPNAAAYAVMLRIEVAETPAEPESAVPVAPVTVEAAGDVAGEAQPQLTEAGTPIAVQTAESAQDGQVMTQLPQEQQAQTVQETETVKPEDVKGEVRSAAPQAEAEEAPELQEGEVVSVRQPVFQETEAVPVKVGETYELDTQSADMEAKLADMVRQAADAGTQKVEIRLTPEHLGALTIEVTRSSDGVLQVILHASSNRAAGLLNQGLDNLHLALQSMGQDQVQLTVQRGEEASHEQPFQHTDPDGQGQQQQRERQEKEQPHGEDFLQQLRLGLFSLDEAI